MSGTGTPSSVKDDDRIWRHRLTDRSLHWVSAVSVLVLLITGFLPVVGVNFEWVTIHWVTGLILLAAVAVHIVASIRKGQFMRIWFGWSDIKIVLSMLSSTPEKPGKYSPAQKLMHAGVTVLVLATLVTGLIMMVRIDTPLWERNIYLFEDTTWGVIYVVHGLAAMALISTAMLHIYFSLRPEKLMYFRSMLRGWMTRGEMETNHDVSKWSGDRT